MTPLWSIGFSTPLGMNVRRYQSESVSSCSPIMCEPLGVHVRRRSLLTTRELRYLKNIGVHRVEGRSWHYTRNDYFSLIVWPLTVHNRESTKSSVSTTSESGNDLTQTVTRDLTSTMSTDELCNSLSLTKIDRDFENPIPVDQLPVPDLGDLKRPNFQAINNGSAMPQQLLTVCLQVPPWAYIVNFRASKTVLGKRAVQRNRAKRRIRAVVAQIFPQFARRRMEYRFILYPDILIVQHDFLMEEVCIALKAVDCWQEIMTVEMLRREKFCKR